MTASSSCSRQRQGACVAAQHSTAQQWAETNTRRGARSGDLPIAAHPILGVRSRRCTLIGPSAPAWTRCDAVDRCGAHALTSTALYARRRTISLTMPFLLVWSRRRSAAGRLLRMPACPSIRTVRASTPAASSSRLRLANCTNVRSLLSHYSLSARSTPLTSPSTFFTLHSRTRPLADECPFPQTPSNPLFLIAPSTSYCVPHSSQS